MQVIPEPAEQEKTELGDTRSGLQPNLAAALAYVFTIITGTIFFIIEKENKYVRFHAMQAILMGTALFIIWTILAIFSAAILPFMPISVWFINSAINLVAGLGWLILWALLMYKAYHGKKFKLPVIGNIAERKA